MSGIKYGPIFVVDIFLDVVLSPILDDPSNLSLNGLPIILRNCVPVFVDNLFFPESLPSPIYIAYTKK